MGPGGLRRVRVAPTSTTVCALGTCEIGEKPVAKPCRGGYRWARAAISGPFYAPWNKGGGQVARGIPRGPVGVIGRVAYRLWERKRGRGAPTLNWFTTQFNERSTFLIGFFGGPEKVAFSCATGRLDQGLGWARSCSLPLRRAAPAPPRHPRAHVYPRPRNPPDAPRSAVPVRSASARALCPVLRYGHGGHGVAAVGHCSCVPPHCALRRVRRGLPRQFSGRGDGCEARLPRPRELHPRDEGVG